MVRKLPRAQTFVLLACLFYSFLQVLLVWNSKDRSSDNVTFIRIDDIHRSTTTPVWIDLKKEIEKGRQYANSIKDTQRKLVFVHIPKAAGTTVEDVGGLQARLAWGSCLFNHKPKRPGGVCQYPPGQFEWPSKIG
jgi:hypothetical protein